MLQGGVTLDERYVLREPIGRGGMGEVWRADDTVLGRVVAVKVLLSGLSGDTEFAERFYAEARAMAALSDPNIVEVYDYGQAFGMAYLVMQLVPGEPLHAVLRRRGPLPAHEVMNLVTQAGRALHHAHINGFVHRDVKPGNLLIRPDGRLVLTDFGIARSIAASRLTQSGFIVGTPSYLAPEQFAGAPSGPAADIYALGVVAYECLTLHPPFVADTPAALAAMQVRNEPPPLPPSVPESARTVVMRALAKEPSQRWATAAAMADAAVAAAAGAVVPWVPERRPGPAPAGPGPAPMGSSGRLAVPGAPGRAADGDVRAHHRASHRPDGSDRSDVARHGGAADGPDHSGRARGCASASADQPFSPSDAPHRRADRGPPGGPRSRSRPAHRRDRGLGHAGEHEAGPVGGGTASGHFVVPADAEP
jgi:serine/threonine-protein kinase